MPFSSVGNLRCLAIKEMRLYPQMLERRKRGVILYLQSTVSLHHITTSVKLKMNLVSEIRTVKTLLKDDDWYSSVCGSDLQKRFNIKDQLDSIKLNALKQYWQDSIVLEHKIFHAKFKRYLLLDKEFVKIVPHFQECWSSVNIQVDKKCQSWLLTIIDRWSWLDN